MTASELIIKPTKGWGKLNLKELWHYRELLWLITWRNIKGQYRQMALGPLWIIIQPLVSMVIFSVIFGGLAKLPSDGLPYPIFTYTALLPWTYFAGALGKSVGSLVSEMRVISKVYFPRLVVPMSAAISGLVNLGVSFIVLLGMMAFYGFWPLWTIFLLPFYILFAMITALGVGLWGAALAVRFRDLRFAVQYGTQAWMYASPVAYTASLVPDKWQWLYQLNPMYWVIEGFRWVLLGKGHPPAVQMILPMVMVMAVFVTGVWIFRRTERTVVDML